MHAKGKSVRLFLIAILSLSWRIDLLASECEVLLRADKTTVLPFEPVGFVLAIESRTNSAVHKIASRWSSFRVAKENDGQNVAWHTYVPFGVCPAPSPPTELSLQPGQTVTDFCLVHVGFNGDHAFKEPGVFLVQAGTPFGSSNVVKIEVVKPDTLVSAVELLGESRLFMLFDYFSAKGEPATSENLKSFSLALQKLRAMPEAASYEGWFSVCDYLLMGMQGDLLASHERRRKESEYYFKVAKGLLPPHRESLIYAIASSQLEAGDMRAAKTYLSWLASDASEGYYKCVAKHQLRFLATDLK